MSYVALASLAAFGTCAVPSGNLKDPQVWGDYFLDKYEASYEDAMTHVEPGPPPLAQPRTVLLITGVTIPAKSFDPIKLRLERDGFRPVVYEPPALLSGDLFENSERLADVVDNILAQTGETKLDILAECTGGLIARHYIQSLGGDEHVSRFVAFISPQNGIAKAPLAADFAGWPALFDLSPGSAFLETVNSQTVPAHIPTTSIYTCTDEYIQPYETSIIPGANNIGVGCNGEFVGHFEFFYDRDIYRLMHSALTVPVADDPTTPPTDPQDPQDPQDPDDSSNSDEGGGCSTTHGSGGAALLIGAIFFAARRRRRA
ncbi:MAG: esterase/lipase family protein [Kofleriaceae bacterium]